MTGLSGRSILIVILIGLVIGSVVGLIGGLLDLPVAVRGAITGALVVIAFRVVQRRSARTSVARHDE